MKKKKSNPHLTAALIVFMVAAVIVLISVVSLLSFIFQVGTAVISISFVCAYWLAYFLMLYELKLRKKYKK